jgi:hypothetical protein
VSWSVLVFFLLNLFPAAHLRKRLISSCGISFCFVFFFLVVLLEVLAFRASGGLI